MISYTVIVYPAPAARQDGEAGRAFSMGNPADAKVKRIQASTLREAAYKAQPPVGGYCVVYFGGSRFNHVTRLEEAEPGGNPLPTEAPA